VKRLLDNRETYNEFLKLVNLFTQDYIDMARLVRDSRNFLGEGELMRQFKEILGWDERRERESCLAEQQGWVRPVSSAGVLDRPSRAELSLRFGSYRKLPAGVSLSLDCLVLIFG
jgi:paired amphipathic helix protein Sin3a